MSYTSYKSTDYVLVSPDHQTDSESFCLQLLQRNNCLYYGPLGHDPTLSGLQVPVTSIIRTRQYSMSQNLLL